MDQMPSNYLETAGFYSLLGRGGRFGGKWWLLATVFLNSGRRGKGFLGLARKRFVPQQELSADEAFWYHMLNPSTKSSDALPFKIEAPKELPKVSYVNESLKKLKLHLFNFDKVVKIKTTPNAQTEELENSVAKLILENKRLCNEINHVKRVFKEQFDLIKKTCGHTKEQRDSLIDKLNLKSAKPEDLKAQIQNKVFVITSLKNDLRKLKGKEIVDIAAQTLSAYTIVSGMFKLDLDPLAPKLLENREAYIDYLKYTQAQADILRGIVKQAKAKQPLDNVLDFSCKHTQRIQALLVYVRDTCPNTIKLNVKKVVVTQKTRSRKFDLLNLSHPQATLSRSKPTCNKRNDKISRTPSRNVNNKLEAKPRNVNKKNSVVVLIRDFDVKHSLLNANCEPICANFKKAMFDGVHDKCLLDFVKNVNSHAKITSANVVPLKKTTSNSVETQKPELKVYSRKPKNIKNVGSNKKAKIVESENANHSEPNHTWGSKATYILSSSSLVMTGPRVHSMTPATSSLGLVPNIISQQPCILPKRDDWDHLFQPMFDEYFTPSSIVVSPVPVAVARRAVDLDNSPVSTSIEQDAPSTNIPSIQEQEYSLNISQGFEESQKTPTFCDDPLHESLHEASTSQ
nr:hypothetical protein [Tanacetum cinerariifolium]